MKFKVHDWPNYNTICSQLDFALSGNDLENHICVHFPEKLFYYHSIFENQVRQIPDVITLQAKLIYIERT